MAKKKNNKETTSSSSSVPGLLTARLPVVTSSSQQTTQTAQPAATKPVSTTTATKPASTTTATPTAQQVAAQKVPTYSADYTAPALTKINPYVQSKEVTEYQKLLEKYQDDENKPEFSSKYGKTIAELADKIANREDFSYDFNADPMYQNYKDQYTRQAILGTQNATAQAAALTGGYGNSYAATAGNLAYQESMSQLNNVIPQLYQMAYDKYQNDIAGQRADLSMYQGLDNTDYSRYRDDVSDWYTDRDYYSNAYWNARNFDYGQYRDSVSDTHWADEMAQQNYQAAKQYTANEYWNNYNAAYQQNRDDIADRRYEDETAYNRRRDDISDQRYENETAYERQQADFDRQFQEQQFYRSVYESDRDFNWQKKVYKNSLKDKASGGSGSSGGYRGRSGSSSGSSSGITSAQRGVYSTLYSKNWKNGNEGQARVAWDSLHGGVIGQKYGLTADQADYLYYEYLGFKNPPSHKDTGSDGADKNMNSEYKYQSIDDVPEKYRGNVLSYTDFMRNLPSDDSLKKYKSYPEYLTKTINRLKKKGK